MIATIVTTKTMPESHDYLAQERLRRRRVPCSKMTMPRSSYALAGPATDFPTDDEDAREGAPTSRPGPTSITQYSPFLMVANGSNAGTVVPATDGMIIGRAPSADLVLDSARISRRHAMVRVSDDGEVSLIDVDSRNGLHHEGQRVSAIALADYRPVTLGDIVLVLVRLETTNDQVVKNLVQSGSLHATTGLLTEHAFRLALSDKFLGAARHLTPLSFVMFGIDAVDDGGRAVEMSHALLRQVGVRIRRAIRPAEQVLVGRSGPHDIAVVMPLDVEIALLFAERCRTGVSMESFRIDGTSRRVTLSAGIATNRLSAHDLVMSSANALAEARARGGNRIVRAS